MKNQIVATRTFNAPLKLVWKIWTDPDLIMRWWGPAKFTCTLAKLDFREGGRSLVNMKAPKEMGGQEWFSIWDYKQIVPLQSIEFIQNLADKDGNKMSPVKVGMPADFPEDVRTVVLFKSLGENKTEMSITQYADMGQMSEFAKLGLEQSADKMIQLF